MDSNLEQQLVSAFRRLDDADIRLAAESISAEETWNDRCRIIVAFGYLAIGNTEKADPLIAAIGGDGTASLADFAYIRAFRRELEGDYEGIIEMLSHHLEAEDATHGGRMRLRVADALIKLERWGEIAQALGPLLEPPGTPDSLEAHLIILEAMVRTKDTQERLIEQTTLIDVLLERGFRLNEAQNAVYYARLMDTHRIEPPIGPLLKGHEHLIDQWTPDGEGVVQFLVAAGDKHKAPGAIRAAARGYIQNPFKWEDADPEKVAYLFASHDEHEAARQTILNSFSKSAIKKNQNLWGPLLLETYHSGHWREALEILREHRVDISRGNTGAHAAMVRAVCEYHLGRFSEAMTHFDEARAQYGYTIGETGNEAACEILCLAVLEREGEMGPRAAKLISARKEEGEYIDALLTAIMNELIIRDLDKALSTWIDALRRLVPAQALPSVFLRLGEVLVEWSKPAAAAQIAGALKDLGNKAGATMTEALVASIDDRENSIVLIDNAVSEAEDAHREMLQFQRVRLRRKAGKYPEALAELEELLTREKSPRRHALLAMKAGILRDRGEELSVVDDVLRQAGEHSQHAATSRDVYQMMVSEIRGIFAGESPDALERQLKSVRAGEPGSVEVLRLARKLLNTPDATAKQRDVCREIAEQWIAENLNH